MSLKQRFKILEFTNRSGTTSWRVTGTRKNGERVRENYSDQKSALGRHAALECEFHSAAPQEAELLPTKLTKQQLSLAEAAFNRLLGGEVPCDEADILRAVDAWVANGKPKPAGESPRLDDAVKRFCDWLDSKECDLREPTKKNLRLRVNVFANSTGNLRLSEIDADTIYGFLAGRTDVGMASKNNDRRALSRFFGWCIAYPNRWIKINPARKEHRDRRNTKETAPAILTIAECKKLLREAETFKEGRLAPYVAVCLFAGLRPFEAQRLTWKQVNLTDGEIRLEGWQTKTGRPRVISIIPMIQNGHLRKGPSTLLKWLEKYKGKDFFPTNWRKDFDVLKHAIGYNGANRKGDAEKTAELKPWIEDLMRHTAISHFWRLTGSYGQTAEQFGNSEGVIKAHYQGQVSTVDTKAFYKLLPKRGAQ